MTASLPTIPPPGPFDQLLSLQGKCAVVTGGSRGLGEATVFRLAQAGAAVVFTGRGAEALAAVERELSAAGYVAVGIQADISRLGDSQQVIDSAVQRFGRVDILVNNAALYTPSFALDTSEELFDSVVGADLKGAFFLAQYAAKAMIAAGGGGRIINLLSVDAFKPMGPLAAYASAKAGLWAATQNLAKELAPHQILVNAVTPGSTITEERLAMLRDGTFAAAQVPTEASATLARLQGAVESGGFIQMLTTMMPLGRPGWPDEIAKAVLFLASDLGSYVSGANVVVDGAQSLR
ncbi:SDR family oxidoreductase [Mycobacterium sp. SM1]|uniref:SDR family NAD(P)-dependent oxidoreductase n=1 Tax=Mycobacterium sp. SM1 TaxID=2816243 RepID=UPI001BD04569|nr:SDR family oxidoreductase [Mycobacterium sp. SM1]MBS4730158.1 SDR family oxidoreductase [Mycobacterium sp. SM1]